MVDLFATLSDGNLAAVFRESPACVTVYPEETSPTVRRGFGSSSSAMKGVIWTSDIL